MYMVPSMRVDSLDSCHRVALFVMSSWRAQCQVVTTGLSSAYLDARSYIFLFVPSFPDIEALVGCVLLLTVENQGCSSLLVFQSKIHFSLGNGAHDATTGNHFSKASLRTREVGPQVH